MQSGQLREECRRVLRHVLATRGWRLVRDEERFLDEVVAEVQQRQRRTAAHPQGLPAEKVIEQVVVYCYCTLWHAACAADGSHQQEEAFRELYDDFRKVAAYRVGDQPQIAEESVQGALVKVWKNIRQVKEPGAFLHWTRMVLSREIADRLAEALGSREVAGSDLGSTGDELEALPAPKEAAGKAPPSDLSTSEERLAELRAAIATCLPGRERLQLVIIRRFLENRSVREVAQELDITPNHVYQMTHEARQILLKCGALLDWAEGVL